MSSAAELFGWRAPPLAMLPKLLAPNPGRAAFALRLALICALTTLVVEIYQTPEPALAVYVVFFLNKPDRVESLLLNVVFTVLITVIIAFVLLLAILVIDAPLWRLAIMSAFSIGFLFIAFASKLRLLAGTVTLIVGYALDLLGSVQTGEFTTRALLYAWLFVGIPAGVSVVVNLLLAPSPRRLAQRAIAARLRVAAARLRQPNERTQSAFSECLREGVGEIQSWLKLAGIEKTSPPRDLAALQQSVLSTAAILSWVDVVTRRDPQSSGFPTDARAHVAQTLEDMARILNSGGYPVEIALDERDAPTPASGPWARLWADLHNTLATFADPPPSEPGPATPEPAQQGGFFRADAFTNPEYVHYALKTTAAAMFCYVLYSLLDWPGIHTCFITCYIVALGTTAETVEKLSLRILGCLVGAAIGLAAIVFVTPSLTSIGALMAVVFLGALASAWVAAGSPRISYAGFQIAFAFFLCVIQGPSPAFDLTVARDRVIGILLGNLVAYLVFAHLWPVSVATRIDSAIAAVLQQLRAMAATGNPTTRLALAAQVQGALGEIEQDIALSNYEPATIRPDASWIQTRRQAADEIGALQCALLINGGSEHSAQLTHLGAMFGLEDSHQPMATAGRTATDATT